MNAATSSRVLTQSIGPDTGRMMLVKQVLLVALGIGALILAAKTKVPMWPVPMTMGTFAVLSIGTAYGPRLGVMTILGYLTIGAMGFDVFAGSSAEKAGLAYMMGGTGGYLLGYVPAALALGALAQRGWDRSFATMVLAMLIGNVLIYLPGLAWLGQLYGWDKPILQWGLTPFLVGDTVKLLLAALILPGLWKLVGTARR